MSVSAVGLLAGLVLAQAAGPGGVVSAGIAGTEVKTLEDVFRRHEAVRVPEYQRSVVMMQYRTPETAEVMRVETLLAPERVLLRMKDLEGTDLVLGGTPKEFWSVNHRERVFHHVALPGDGGEMLTRVLRESLFAETNTSLTQGALSYDNPFGPSFRFVLQGVPVVNFSVPLTLIRTKRGAEAVEYQFYGKANEAELMLTVSAVSSGRVTKVDMSFMAEENEVGIVLEEAVYSVEPLGRDLFEFPAKLTEGYSKGD